MADFTTAAGQSVFDIALQVYGSIEEIGKVLPLLSSVTDEIQPNTVLALPDATENTINQFFINKKAVATRSLQNESVLLTPEGDAVLTPEGTPLEFI